MSPPNRWNWRKAVEALSSLNLSLLCLSLLMVLTVLCTLAQVSMGTHGAVEWAIRSFLVWWRPQGSPIAVPIFPGGGLVGLVLLANLLTAQYKKLEWSRRKAGLWLAHLGLALLFVGEFVTAFFQVESHLAVEVGQTRDFAEDSRRLELAVVDQTEAGFDTLTAIPASLAKEGARLSHASLPFSINVKRFHENAELHRESGQLHVHPRPPVTSDEEQNASAVQVELLTKGASLGTLWLSNALETPETLTVGGRRFSLALRQRRYYLPFSLTLKEFRHDRYAGTDIPKNFSSLVRLQDPGRGEDRDVLISMNNPLRHAGKTFYQSSFGKNDTLSIFQVVRNPGWLLPYLSCTLVASGMLLHFGLKLSGALGAAR